MGFPCLCLLFLTLFLRRWLCTGLRQTSSLLRTSSTCVKKQKQPPFPPLRIRKQNIQGKNFPKQPLFLEPTPRSSRGDFFLVGLNNPYVWCKLCNITQ